MLTFITLFLTVFSAPFLWVAYICFREKYHRLVTVFAAIGAVVICGMLISLPERLGIQDFFFHEVLDHPWLIIIDLPLSLICLFWPFWAAAWFFRFCHRLATRYLHDATSKARNA
jgi:threonine/homoserine efflux transporter RhtA